MTTATKQPEPFFKVSRIVYFTDLSTAGARVIPLGVFGEVMLPHVQALGLKARSVLTADELKLISPLIRDRLESPFKFFRSEFDLAWENGAYGRSLEFLSKRHSASLSILAPADVDIADRRWLFGRAVPPREDAVEGKLSAAVDTEFAELMKADRDHDHVPGERKVIEVDIDPAAAA